MEERVCDAMGGRGADGVEVVRNEGIMAHGWETAHEGRVWGGEVGTEWFLWSEQRAMVR